MEPADPVFRLIDLPTMRGLEIGPLHRPRVSKTVSDVRYVDHYSTNELRERYAANSQTMPYLDEIVEVDYVVKDSDSISTVAKRDGLVDYIIASHVIEHIANPIGWLQDASTLLAPSGVISLVIPDKRFCFDVNRAVTLPQEWVDWYLRELRAPSYAQLFDFFAHVTTIDGSVDTAGLWAGTADYATVRRSDVPDADSAAYSACRQYKDTGEYMDVHAGVYTPESFLSLLEVSMKLELLDFEVAHMVPTPANSLEFYLTLRKISQDSSEHRLHTVALARRQLEGADRPACGATDNRDSSTSTAPSPRPGTTWLEVSDKELRLIAAKRKSLQRIRAR